MDNMLLVTIIGTVVATGGLIIAYKQFHRTRKKESPAVRIDNMSYGMYERDPVPYNVTTQITNTGDGLAKEINVYAWIYMVNEQKFKVPTGTEAGEAHFTAYFTSLKSGESKDITLMRNLNALEMKSIPQFDPIAVPVTRVLVKFMDVFGKKFEQAEVTAGEPSGERVVGTSHRPK